MAKYEDRVHGDFQQILTRLQEDIKQSGLSVNLVDQSDYELADVKVAVRVYDKYFMRNGNRASLSLTLVGRDGEIFVSAIGAGGGSGSIFNFSLGAESEMANVVADSIHRMTR